MKTGISTHKLFLSSLLIILSFSAKSSSFFFPDSDTGLLISLVANTAQQLTRLEQLVTETDKHTKLFRESVELIEERYEVVDQLQSMAQNYARISNSRPEDLASINDAIEDLKNQKERLVEIIKEARKADLESKQIRDDNKLVEKVVSSDSIVARKQIMKSFGSGKHFSKNMDRVNAQNTGLILKETISLNGAVNSTNGLLATQNSLSKIQVDQIISDKISRENALAPMKKGKRK
jgi:hypothetical protein